MPTPGTRPPALVVVSLLAFTGFLVLLIAQSLVPRHVSGFAPSAVGARSHLPVAGHVDTVTLDARDERTWQYFDLDRGTLLTPPDTQGWDLAARRFRIIAAGDGIADLGAAILDSVAAVPDTGYIATRYAGDTTNPAIGHWYRYGFLSHVLRPNGHVYVMRTDGGSYAKLEIVSYYCPGSIAGCLTFRYTLSPPGAHRFP